MFYSNWLTLCKLNIHPQIPMRSLLKYAEIDRLSKHLIKKWSESKSYTYKANTVAPATLSLFEGEMISNYNHFIRDFSSLSWRYEDHLVFHYDSFIVRGQGRGVGIVVRIDNIESMRIMHIVDFFGDSKDFAAGLSFIDDFSHDKKISVADFYCPSTKITRCYLSAGWFSILDDYFFQFIHLFHPPELRKPPTTSFMCWSKKDMEYLLDISKLYITKEDLDLDRPTVAYFENVKAS